ncbi:MAG: TetR/AcrR family transcriptional regulator [Spirochaetales bacterium]|nr:TetR/AcrR family transcriptional regulator [Spirochaetales bacterium]
MGDIRKKILDEAGKLILDQGVTSFSMEDLAKSAGITKKTIYNHFPGRDEVMKSAAREKIQSLVNTMTKIAEDERLDFPYRLGNIFRFGIKEYSALFPQSGYEKNKETFFSIYLPIIKTENLRLVKEVIHSGITSGHLRDDIGEETMAIMFLHIVEGWGKLEEYGIASNVDDFFTFTRKVLLEGCLTQYGRGEIGKITGNNND